MTHDLWQQMNQHPEALFAASASDLVHHPGTPEAQLSSRLGDAIGSVLERTRLLQPLGNYSRQLDNPRRQTGVWLWPALLAGLGGAGFNWGTNRNPMTGLLLGAGLGGLAGLGMHQWQHRPTARTKRSFYVSGQEDPLAYIQARLMEDNNLSSGQRAQFLQQVAQLPSGLRIDLARLLKSAVGASVGYIVGRFLLNFGGLGTALFAGLGALLSGSSSGGPVNMYGQRLRPDLDLLGRPR